MSSGMVISLTVIVHGAEELKMIHPSLEMKPAVTCSVYSNGTATSYLQTLVDEGGGVNPSWEFTGNFIFTAKINDYLMFDIKHHGNYLGKRSIGQAIVPIQLLLAGDGIGTRISYPVIRSGKRAGEIIVSHEIKQVVDGIIPDPVIINGGDTPQAPAPAPEDGNTNPPRRFSRFSPLSLIADCMSIANNASEMAE